MITAAQKVVLQDYFDEQLSCAVLPAYASRPWRVLVARWDGSTSRTIQIAEAATRWEALARAKEWLDSNPVTPRRRI